MNKPSAHVVCITITLTIGYCYGISGSLYSEIGNYQTVGSPLSYQTQAAFRGMCALICNNDANCVTFSYDRTTEVCHLSGGILPSVIGIVFGPRIAVEACPVTRGFNIFIRQKNILCLKMLPPRKRSSAKGDCNSDNAHLVLVENESAFRFIGDIMADNNLGAVWVDAYDSDDDGTCTTSRGGPLPHIPDGSVILAGNALKCTQYIQSAKIFEDVSCSSLLDILCQIDM